MCTNCSRPWQPPTTLCFCSHLKQMPGGYQQVKQPAVLAVSTVAVAPHAAGFCNVLCIMLLHVKCLLCFFTAVHTSAELICLLASCQICIPLSPPHQQMPGRMLQSVHSFARHAGMRGHSAGLSHALHCISKGRDAAVVSGVRRLWISGWRALFCGQMRCTARIQSCPYLHAAYKHDAC